MVIKWDVTIPKLSGEKTRKAYIYLPDSYEKEPEQRYPVMYMFDGHNVFFDEDATFGKSWGMNRFMEKTKKELIIVGVECNHEGNKRLIEYAPFNYENSEHGKIKGKGSVYMNWLVKTLKFTINNIKRNRECARQVLSGYLMEQQEGRGYSEDKLELRLLYEDIFSTEDFQLIKELAVDGKSHLEMAQARGISVNACKKRVQRAKEKLWKKMKKDVT